MDLCCVFSEGCEPLLPSYHVDIELTHLLFLTLVWTLEFGEMVSTIVTRRRAATRNESKAETVKWVQYRCPLKIGAVIGGGGTYL